MKKTESPSRNGIMSGEQQENDPHGIELGPEALQHIQVTGELDVHHPDNDRLGSWLKRLRRSHPRPQAGPKKARHQTQSDVALRAGVTSAYIGHLEDSRCNLPQSAEARARIAQAYGLTPQALERMAAAYGQGLGGASGKRGRPKKGTPTQPPVAHPMQRRKTPFVELEWAFHAALQDRDYSGILGRGEPVSTPEEKASLVRIYEHLTQRPLLSPENREALTVLADPRNPAEENENGAAPSRGQHGSTTASLLHELEALLQAFDGEESIPKGALVTAWLQAVVPLSSRPAANTRQAGGPRAKGKQSNEKEGET